MRIALPRSRSTALYYSTTMNHASCLDIIRSSSSKQKQKKIGLQYVYYTGSDHDMWRTVEAGYI